MHPSEDEVKRKQNGAASARVFVGKTRIRPHSPSTQEHKAPTTQHMHAYGKMSSFMAPTRPFWSVWPLFVYFCFGPSLRKADVVVGGKAHERTFPHTRESTCPFPHATFPTPTPTTPTGLRSSSPGNQGWPEEGKAREVPGTRWRVFCFAASSPRRHRSAHLLLCCPHLVPSLHPQGDRQRQAGRHSWQWHRRDECQR